MDELPFRDAVTSAEALRALVGKPSELAVRKEISHLDAHCRAFIARSPFVLIATSGASGRADVSPKGDPPGFVQVLDEHRLVIPDRPGNRRLDGMRNLLENPHVGLLFLIPGLEETLRVNGRAWIIRDEEVLARCAVMGSARPSRSASTRRSASSTAPRPSSARSSGSRTSGPIGRGWRRPRRCWSTTPVPRT